MKTGTTTALQLLSLVFEGHDIRTVMQSGRPLFIATDVAKACGISKAYDVIKTHVENDHLTSISLEVRSANGTRQNRSFQCVTQGGVFALVMGSRKSEARKFQRWLADEVLPQLLKYGTYAPGATTGERCAALRTRWMEERATGKARDAEAYAASGLLTIAAFRQVSTVPVRNVLEFCAVLRSKAALAGYEPQRFYTGPKRHTPAWPLDLLQDAARATTHFLPFSLEN